MTDRIRTAYLSISWLLSVLRWAVECSENVTSLAVKRIMYERPLGIGFHPYFPSCKKYVRKRKSSRFMCVIIYVKRRDDDICICHNVPRVLTVHYHNTYIHVRIYCQTVADVISQSHGHLRTTVISELWSSQNHGHLKTAVISVQTNIYRNIWVCTGPLIERTRSIFRDLCN